MQIVMYKNGFKVASQTSKGVWYIVNREKQTCSCPEYAYRMAKIGGICKHINAVETYIANKGQIVKEPSVMYKKDIEQKKKELIKKEKEKFKLEKEKNLFLQITDYVKIRGNVPIQELKDRYGDEIIATMLRLGYLYLEEDNARSY